MNKMIVKFSSVTYAMKAKELISRNGGRATVRKNPKPSKNEGCGYILTVNGNPDKIIFLFDSNGIKYVSYEMVR